MVINPLTCCDSLCRSRPAYRGAAVGRQRSLHLQSRHRRRSGGEERGPGGAAGARYVSASIEATSERQKQTVCLGSYEAQWIFCLSVGEGFRWCLCCSAFLALCTAASMATTKSCCLFTAFRKQFTQPGRHGQGWQAVRYCISVSNTVWDHMFDYTALFTGEYLLLINDYTRLLAHARDLKFQCQRSDSPSPVDGSWSSATIHRERLWRPLLPATVLEPPWQHALFVFEERLQSGKGCCSGRCKETDAVRALISLSLQCDLKVSQKKKKKKQVSSLGVWLTRCSHSINVCSFLQHSSTES